MRPASRRGEDGSDPASTRAKVGQGVGQRAGAQRRGSLQGARPQREHGAALRRLRPAGRSSSSWRRRPTCSHERAPVPLRAARRSPRRRVLRLRRYVRVPYRRRAALSRRGVFLRDGHQPASTAASPAENVDHVVPRSRSWPHAWENVVASCRRCNSRKKDRTPDEAGMALRRQPYAPRRPSGSSSPSAGPARLAGLPRRRPRRLIGPGPRQGAGPASPAAVSRTCAEDRAAALSRTLVPSGCAQSALASSRSARWRPNGGGVRALGGAPPLPTT
jgi:5-methylcytosine-specific restriction endonuclease McrA